MLAVVALACFCACGGGGDAGGNASVPITVTSSPTGSPNSTPNGTPTSVPTNGPGSSNGVAQLGGCTIFPADNAWNEDVSQLPVDPNSATYLASMNASSTNLHPDFGSNPTYGIPYVIVPATQAAVPVSFTYASESDPGPYPIPSNAPIEGGPGASGDRHVLVLQSGTCQLYEMWNSTYVGPGWTAGSGAKFNLNSDALRPDYWTSADAAGLPILPALVKYDEAQGNAIYHALRFTVNTTQAGFIHPATHFASSSTNPALPPMGLRVRLKASYSITGFTGESYAVLVALKKYGMLLADNGSDWYITGATDSRWDDNDLNQLKSVPASAFEVVETGPIIH
jgi:hypothetical protein